MSPLAKQVKECIALIKNADIQQLLLTHLKEDAENLSEIFCKIHGNDSQYSAQKLPHKSIIPLAYTYAPKALVHLLTKTLIQLEEKEIVLFLDKKQDKQSTLKIILSEAPQEEQMLILYSMANMEEKNLRKLLLDNKKSAESFRYFLKLITKASDESALILLNITNNASFFTSLPSNAATDFFKTKPREKVALAFLSMLEFYEDKVIATLFAGSSSILESENLLHVGLTHPSAKVIEKLFSLFKRLNKTQQYALMTHKEKHHLLPLDVLFRKEEAVNTVAVIKELNAYPSLMPLLEHTSLAHHESPMHKAARLKNKAAIITYLEQSYTSLQALSFGNKKSIYEVAVEVGFTEISTIDKAVKLKRILEKKDLSAEDKECAKALIHEDKNILNLCFSKQQTLLHLAVLNKKPTLVKRFLKSGANFDTKNDSGNNALTIAITSQEEASFKVLLDYIPQQSPFPMQEILASKNFNLIKIALAHLENKPALAEAALLSGLKNLNEIRLSKEEQAYFLLTFIKNLQKHASPALTQAFNFFIKEQLKKLTSSTSHEKEALRAELANVLLAMPIENVSVFLKQLLVSKTLYTELELALCHGLVQPNTLKVEEYRALLNHLSKEACVSVASLFFQKAPLATLDPQWLQDLVNLMSLKSLYEHAFARADSLLIVLSLQKYLALEPDNLTPIDLLTKRLLGELALFNQKSSPLSLAHLEALLNNTKHPLAKKIIQDFLKTVAQDAPIHQAIEALFSQISEKTTLSEESLLKALYMQKAATSAEDCAALSQLLPKLSEKEVLQVLAARTKGLQSQLVMHNLLNTNQSNLQLVPWLANLPITHAKVLLVEYSHNLNTINKHIKTLVVSLNAEIYDALKPSLIPTQKAIKALSDTLSTLTSEVDWKKTIQIHEQDLLAKVSLLKADLNNRITHANLSQLYLLDILKDCLLQVEDLHTHLKKRVKVIDLDEQLLKVSYQKSLDKEATKPLIKLFHNAQLDSEAEKAVSFFNEDIYKTISNLETNLIAGIKKHPQAEKLITALIDWHGENVPFQQEKNALLQQLANWLPNINLDANQTLALYLHENRRLYMQAEYALSCLLPLPGEALDIEQVLATLMELDENRLKDLESLSIQASIPELAQLTLIALDCKTLNIPLKAYSEGFNLGNISDYLNQTVKKLSDWAGHLSSIQLLQMGLYADNKNSLETLKKVKQQQEDQSGPLNPEAVILFIKSWQGTLDKDLFSKESQALIDILSLIMQQGTLALQLAILNQLPLETSAQIFDHCLSGISSDDAKRVKTCKSLLTLMTQLGMDNPVFLQSIKQKLGEQNLDFLDAWQLQSFALSILDAKTGSLKENTYNGVWIQRLLTSVEFVASSKPEVLQALVERYRLLSLTLKQDEFDHIKESNKEALIAKKQRLLSFRADDSIRSLLNKLEQDCRNLEEENPLLAQKAQETLYAYYHLRLSNFRTDSLFSFSNYIYKKLTCREGDLSMSKNTLLSWMKHYMPHQNFEQQELLNHQQVFVYDENLQKIGFINESNQVLTIIDEAPEPLLNTPNTQVGMVLYDENRRRIGTLSQESELERESLFQQYTSSKLLNKVPDKKLKKSPQLVELLIQDVLVNQALDTLYQSKEMQEDTAKRIYIEQKVNQQLLNNKSPLSKATLMTAIKYHSETAILELLSKIEQGQNADALFRAILDNPQKRVLLFTQGQTAFNEYVKRFDAKVIFSDFLTHHYDKPWFKEGLTLFAAYNKKDWLVSALQHLNKQSLNPDIWQNIMQTLLQEENAQMVLQDFLQDDNAKYIQDADTDAVLQFTSFLSKANLVPCIETLNQTRNWGKSATYRLLLLTFANQHNRLFPREELRYTLDSNWDSKNLNSLTQFTQRHLEQIPSLDKDLHLGNKLLSELALRTANFGQTAIFYKENGQLNDKIATKILERSTLNTLLAPLNQFWGEVGSKIKSFFSASYAKKQAEMQILKDNNGVIDWDELLHEAWSQTNEKQLPLICAWLMHYSGPVAPVQKLLKDYFTVNTSVLHIKEHYHPVSHIMSKFPHKEVSAVIFNTLIQRMMDKPKLLDKTLFYNLANFYLKQYAINELDIKAGLLALVFQFGKLKHYDLVKQCCYLLKNEGIDKGLLKEIRVQAKVEKELKAAQNCWYFGILQFFKRTWNYGFSFKPYVAFCENKTVVNTNLDYLPAHVQTSRPSGKAIEKEIALLKKARDLKKRVIAMPDLGKSNVSSNTGLSFFAKANKERGEEATEACGISVKP